MVLFPIRRFWNGSIILMILFKMTPLNHEIAQSNTVKYTES
jgi:hypothetical protein